MMRRNNITEMVLVKVIMNEGKIMGATTFFIGGDLNIEVRLEDGREGLHGRDSLDWYGVGGHCSTK